MPSSAIRRSSDPRPDRSESCRCRNDQSGPRTLVGNLVPDRPLQLRRCMESAQPLLYRITHRPTSLGPWERPHESLRVQVRQRSPGWQNNPREEDRCRRSTSRNVPTPNRVRQRAISSNSSTTLPSPRSLLRSARQISFGPSGSKPDLARRSAPIHEAAQLSSQIFDLLHLTGPNDQDTPSLISQ